MEVMNYGYSTSVNQVTPIKSSCRTYRRLIPSSPTIGIVINFLPRVHLKFNRSYFAAVLLRIIMDVNDSDKYGASIKYTESDSMDSRRIVHIMRRISGNSKCTTLFYRSNDCMHSNHLSSDPPNYLR